MDLPLETKNLTESKPRNSIGGLIVAGDSYEAAAEVHA